MSQFRIAIFFVISVALLTLGFSHEGPVPMYERAQNSVVQITAGPTMGAGVIISEDGYIITNRHVVLGSWLANRSVEVKLRDGRKLPGVIIKVFDGVGINDLALIKIDAPNLQAAVVRRLDLQRGEAVFAIGHPFDGFRWAITWGRVWSPQIDKNHGMPAFVGYIGSHLNIYPGNSGGGLFDMQGRLVGLNTQGLLGRVGFGVIWTAMTGAIPIMHACRLAWTVPDVKVC